MPKSHRTRTRGIHKQAVRGLLHTFVPHKGNGYHPHLIRPIGLTLILVAVLVLQLIAIVPKAGSVKGAQTDFSWQSLLNESNKVRAQNDVPLLNLNDELNTAAASKARDMLARQYWAHVSPDGTTPWYWFHSVKYQYDYAGENLAKGFETSAGVVTAWMNSEEHRRNVLSGDYQDVGFGVAEGTLNGEQTTIVVALYGTPVGSRVAATGKVLAASDGNMSLIGRFGVGLRSLKPSVLGSLALLMTTVTVGLIAYAFRDKQPRSIQKSWKRHHGLYKSIAMAGLILVLITLYGNGQIL